MRKEFNEFLKESGFDETEFMGKELVDKSVFDFSRKAKFPVNYLVMCENGNPFAMYEKLHNLIEQNSLDIIEYFIYNGILVPIKDKLYFIKTRLGKVKVEEISLDFYNELILYLLENKRADLARLISNSELYLNVGTIFVEDIDFDVMSEYLFKLNLTNSFPIYLSRIYEHVDQNSKNLIEEKVIDYYQKLFDLVFELKVSDVPYQLSFECLTYGDFVDEFETTIVYMLPTFYKKFPEESINKIEEIMFKLEAKETKVIFSLNNLKRK